MHRIHRIIPGEHSNCLLNGETLQIGKGGGLFFMHVQYSKGVCSQRIQYGNFKSRDLLLEISDCPVFNQHYLNIADIYPQSPKMKI